MTIVDTIHLTSSKLSIITGWKIPELLIIPMEVDNETNDDIFIFDCYYP